MIKFAAMGEVMIELSHQTETSLTLAFAGDTYNTAVYLSRFKVAEVYYITALGDDPYSDKILAHAKQEGIHVDHIQCLTHYLPGLYFIRLDKNGERRFYYYRHQSAARQMFQTEKSGEILQKLKAFDYLYFSGITLAILDADSREKFYQALLAAKKQGSKIYFDSNYRARLWKNVEEARREIERFSQLCYGVLPTFGDEQLLFGDLNHETTAERMLNWGIKEIVIKMGEKGAFLATEKMKQLIPAVKVSAVVDTTAAGDSFNAGFLAGKISGLNLPASIRQAANLAATVIQQRGAIVPPA